MISRFSIKRTGGYKHTFLSNFYPSPIVFAGLQYPTVEHYYQAQKCLAFADAAAIREAPTPAAAKKLGRRLPLRPTWEADKISVMRAGLELKFAEGTVLAEKLLDTGDELLIEGNDWGDRFWGKIPVLIGTVRDDWVGGNWLGLLLMARRAELRGI